MQTIRDALDEESSIRFFLSVANKLLVRNVHCNMDVGKPPACRLIYQNIV